jgi:hypothetical protein
LNFIGLFGKRRFCAQVFLFNYFLLALKVLLALQPQDDAAKVVLVVLTLEDRLSFLVE